MFYSFSPTILNISILVLSGLLVFVVLGIIVWRIVNQEEHAEVQNAKVGTVSKQFNDFIISQASTTDFEFLYNILIKNKFAEKRFSLIPLIVFSDSKVFLTTNLINSRGYDEIRFTSDDSPTLLKKGKSVTVKNYSLKWMKEIIKYLKNSFPGIEVRVVALVADQKIEIVNHRENLSVCRLLEFEETIQELAKDTKSTSDVIIKKMIDKLPQRNIFKSKISADSKNIGRGKGGR